LRIKEGSAMILSHLLYFHALAEELNYRRAADRLGMSQPSLTRSIQRLEHQLKVKLFERTRQQVTLSPAGRVFLEEVRYLIARYDFAINLTRREAQGVQSQISVAYSRPAWRRVLASAVLAFRELCPDVNVRLSECDADVQLAGLRDGRFDFSFVAMTGIDTRGLEARLITRLKVLAAIPAAWPLTRKKAIRMADLADVPLILFNERIHPAGYTALMLACQSAGFVPKLAQEVSQPHTVVDFVEAGLGVGFISEAARPLVRRDVALRRIIDLPEHTEMELKWVWVQRRLSPHLKTFYDVVEKILAQENEA
jgi:DNA-binding transcriptional LysR family regulator